MKDKNIELTLIIPATMYDRLLETAKKAGYEDTNEFFRFILQELFPAKVEEMDRIEKEVIEKKLKDLGYL